MSTTGLNVYLAGEIHSNWRARIVDGSHDAGLRITFTSPVTDHDASDACGEQILGSETDPFWHDHKSAKINAVRTRNLIKQADVVIVRFGDKYRQWNAAFDAGIAVALGKPLITIHDDSLRHAMKEVDAAAHAVATEPEQVVELLKYVLS